ncbi:TPA: hypothetical protein JLJ42_001151 [Escherichia coli]|uniref:hypothetical protein n=1 Tax=Escherichia coli TaxID=562 RepID=UPI001641F3AE|nr:hypothetical protein [Escherichia coli]EJZ9501532.1 hypothetical protein [Escherichia coli]MCO4884214.1 hypothetical protein [Escherichia coli]HAW0524829.1 hypothetical protein [Escherichia coli]HCN8394617.1 hypothetical protein [Escherichia coli]HDW3617425.1 hypothetical protein [Escherichia coli]
MPDKCSVCIVGVIGSLQVNEGRWAEAEARFQKVIEEWNEKTKRHAVPHPGFANKFNHCPVCGHKVTE